MPFGATYAQMREAAVAAEEAGFDGIWTWDHLRDADYNSGRVPEALVALTGIAEATSRVMLGTLVLNVANRHPGLLANMAATLQEVSGNRFILGLGAGGGPSLPYAPEQTMFGRPVPPDRVRAAQVAEAAQVLRHLWSGERSNFDGEHFQLRGAQGFPRPEVPPPIVVGGWGPRMAGIAGRHADGFNTQAGHPQLGAFAELARREHAASGRNPRRLPPDRLRRPQRALRPRRQLRPRLPRAARASTASSSSPARPTTSKRSAKPARMLRS